MLVRDGGSLTSRVEAWRGVFRRHCDGRTAVGSSFWTTEVGFAREFFFG